MIRAHVYVYGNDFEEGTEADFDAQPWFDQANAAELVNLDSQGYNYSHAADWVFKWIATHTENPELKAALALATEKKLQIETHMDEEDVRRWRKEQKSKAAANKAVDVLLGEEVQPPERDEPFQWSREGLLRLLAALYGEHFNPAYLNEPALMSFLGRIKWIEQAALYHRFEEQMPYRAVGQALATTVPSNMTQSHLPTQTQRTMQIVQKSLNHLRHVLNIRIASHPTRV